MTPDEVLFDAEERMEKAVTVFRDELRRPANTGRATPALVENIRVEYYGSPTPLKQIASISTPDPQQILIRLFDQTALKDTEKALHQRFGHVAQQRRQKHPTQRAPHERRTTPKNGRPHQEIGGRGQGRHPQHSTRRQQTPRNGRKEQEATEDERDKGKEDVQVLTKRFEERAQELCDKKSHEIMEQ